MWSTGDMTQPRRRTRRRTRRIKNTGGEEIRSQGGRGGEGRGGSCHRGDGRTTSPTPENACLWLLRLDKHRRQDPNASDRSHMAPTVLRRRKYRPQPNDPSAQTILLSKTNPSLIFLSLSLSLSFFLSFFLSVCI